MPPANHQPPGHHRLKWLPYQPRSRYQLVLRKLLRTASPRAESVFIE